MKTTVEQLTPTRAKLTIAVTPEELKPSIAHAYEHIASQVSIPGFRKGKVPPAIIDQRVGRDEVLRHAVSEGVEGYYRQAVTEEKVRVLGRPELDIETWPEAKDFSGDLVLVVEVDIRPEFAMPDLEKLTVTVDAPEVGDEDIEREFEALRTRFATLVTVDRPAATGDFVQLDLIATIDGVEVDSASGISYEVGSGELLEGIDEAIDSLTGGESTSFDSVLLGGDHEGETAHIEVTVTAVKERELPDADDDFAQLASPFDTIDELKADLREQAGRSKVFEVGAQARDRLLEALLEKVEIPVPEKLVEDEVHRHLEGEGRLEDDEHRAEVTESSEKQFRNQILLDVLAEQEEVEVSREELTNYLVRAAAQYGMSPNDFITALSQGGQIPAMVSEVARSKALVLALGKAKVVDGAGKDVDVSEFVKAVAGEGGGEPIVLDANEGGEHAGHDHEGHDHEH